MVVMMVMWFKVMVVQKIVRFKMVLIAMAIKQIFRVAFI